MAESKKYYKQLCDIIGGTRSGITGSRIRKVFESYCEEKELNTEYLYDGLEDVKAPNKRTMLLKNLLCFKENERDEILNILAKDNGDWLDLINNKNGRFCKSVTR